MGATRTPLPSGLGHWNTTLFTSSPWVLSSRKYSPRLGRVWKVSPPTMAWTLSASTPAALTTYLASTSPAVVCSRKVSPFFSMDSTLAESFTSAPLTTAVSARAMQNSQGLTMAAEGA